jgi:hypothetical protein
MARERLPIDSVTDLVLLLLLENEKDGVAQLAGTTRLQKLVFLLTQREDFKRLAEQGAVPSVAFQPFRMGPFTPELYEAVELLSEFDPPLVVVEESADRQADIELERYVDELDLDRFEPSVSRAPRPTTYRLTASGATVARRLWSDAPPELQEAIREIVAEYGPLNLRDLLRHVYKDYPQYTSRSEIKQQLGLP